jgi:CPA1 family monovalent cation:H+ antiporter
VRELLLVGALIAGVIVLTPLAAKVRVPQPVLLTIFGLGLALVPGTPELRVDPQLILPVVLPPLLFAAAQRTTVQQFRHHAVPVLLLAVGLTVATAAVVAVVAHLAGLPWTVAFVLGAIVSPPDPVAATAVARRLRLPERLVSVLEGEGLFNDAAALVIYKTAVAATVVGTFSTLTLGRELLLSLVVGTLLGLALGWLTRWALLALVDASAETTVVGVMPFAAYLLAEELHGSGVLAVLAFALFLRSRGHTATTSRGWLLGRAVWAYAEFLITSLVFALVGYALVKVGSRETVTADTVRLAVAVLVAVVLFRPVWIFAVSWAARGRHGTPAGWRECTVASWSGMRGVVTVATALALPLAVDGGGAFPHRDQVVIAALACVLVTLVVQGLTLPLLVHRLGVAEDDDDAHEAADLRRRAAEAALDHVRMITADGVRDSVREAALREYEGYVAAQAAIADVRSPGDPDPGAASDAERDRVLSDAIAVERDFVLSALHAGRASAGAADEALRDIERRAVRDFG